MTKALVLKSRMRQKSHVRFGSGGRGREAPAYHNWAHIYALLLTAFHQDFAAPRKAAPLSITRKASSNDSSAE